MSTHDNSAEVRQLADWQLVRSTRDGNVLHIDQPAPDREELLGLLRRAIRGQSRLVLEALIKVNAELGAIRNDVQEIRDAIDQADDEMVVKLGPELRDIWSTRSPARDAIDAATLPQMELMAMIKILGSLNDRALSAPLRRVPLDEPGVAPRMSREARAQRDAEIIERYAAGDPPAALAAEFSLTRARVHQIVGKTAGVRGRRARTALGCPVDADAWERAVEDAGITEDQLCDLVALDEERLIFTMNDILNWKAGRSNPPLQTLTGIGRVLGVPAGRLMLPNSNGAIDHLHEGASVTRAHLYAFAEICGYTNDHDLAADLGVADDVLKVISEWRASPTHLLAEAFAIRFGLPMPKSPPDPSRTVWTWSPGPPEFSAAKLAARIQVGDEKVESLCWSLNIDRDELQAVLDRRACATKEMAYRVAILAWEFEAAVAMR